MRQDLRYAIRSVARKPLVATAAVLTLGLGIGAFSTIFIVVHAVVLRPLPFHEPERLVRIWELTRDGDRFSSSEANYHDVRESARTLTDVAAYDELGSSAVLGVDGEPQRIRAIPVSSSMADVVGWQPQLGRMFDAAEDRAGRPDPRVVLTDSLWRRHFAADPAIIGRSIPLDGVPHVVTGVLPRGREFPVGAEAWIPLGADQLADRTDKSLALIGRLAPGVTTEAARDEVRAIAGRLSREYPRANGGWSADVEPIGASVVGPRFRDAAWILFGAVGLLLLLACVNVANLLLARAVSRQDEMGIRAALGASRGRLVRQLLTESAVLAAGGTVLGVLLAAWSVDAVQWLGAGRIPRLDEIRVEPVVLVFACLAGMASCFIFGLAPALSASRVDLRTAAGAGVRRTAGGRRLRGALVVVEVALALLLLVGAGLLGRSFVRLVATDVGFDSRGIIAMPLDLPSTRYDGERVEGFYRELLERVRALPGVTAAGATSTNPFRESGFSNSVTPVELAAGAPATGLVQAGWRSITPGFFDAMGIPLLGGRDFKPADRGDIGRVAIVTENLARRLWPGESAIGRRVFWGGTTGVPWTIVGTVGDIRDVQLDAEPPPILFVPHGRIDLPSMTLVVRGAPGVTGLEADLVRELRDLDAGLPLPGVVDVEQSRAASMAGPRFNLSLLGAFALIALVLAVTGVYAMLAFSVSERRREIAVRLALGASGGRVARQVLLNGLALGGLGLLAGTGAAAAVTSVLSSLLYSIEPTDPIAFVAAGGVLLGVVAIACYLPARQASRIDPMALLRE